MRVPLALSALALATVFACSNSSNPDITAPGTGTPIGGQPGDVIRPDAGNSGTPDAGTTDAGTNCNLQALPPPGAFTIETCSLGGAQNITTETITGGCNQVLITGGVNCSGFLTGPFNAFSGSCNSLPCTATSVPGTIFCTLQNQTSQCTIQICADATGTSCP
jgi:hypothetical protein